MRLCCAVPHMLGLKRRRHAVQDFLAVDADSAWRQVVARAEWVLLVTCRLLPHAALAVLVAAQPDAFATRARYARSRHAQPTLGLHLAIVVAALAHAGRASGRRYSAAEDDMHVQTQNPVLCCNRTGTAWRRRE